MDPIASTPVPPSLPPPQRHGCFTAWLILMIIANALTAVSMPLALSTLKQATPGISGASVAILSLAALANVIFAIALFRWKRWGFYGFIVTAVIAVVTNLSMGLGIGQSVVGLVGIAVLYGVMQIGGPNKAWPQLQ